MRLIMLTSKVLWTEDLMWNRNNGNEEHEDTEIKLTLDNVRDIWSNQSDQVRMEMIKSIIWCSREMHGFWDKVKLEIVNDKFRKTLE